MIGELASIVITRNIPEHGLRRGDIGAVVHCYKDKATFEVEFVTGKGDTVAVITLESKDVRPMYPNEILHAREIKATQILARGHRIGFHTFFPMVVGVALPDQNAADPPVRSAA